jgi:AbrB family looped-hinge helix DNA binding protein
MKDRIVYGVATISAKGQLAVPVNIRRELGLNEGDQVIILKRKDNAGFSFIRIEMMDRLMDRLRTDDEFFEKL